MDYQNTFYEYKVSQKTDELKRLIAEHPDYPIVVLAGEEANGGDYNWMFCSDIGFDVGEILNVATPYNEEIICCDRDEFFENMQEWLEDDEAFEGLSDEEFDKKLQEEVAKYEPYWEKVIVIWATN